MVKTEYSIAESAMGLNIQNPETYELAKELAELTGESMTTAITRALEERLQRLRHDHRTDREARMARVRALLADIDAAGGAAGAHSSDHNDLYGEDGLPA